MAWCYIANYHSYIEPVNTASLYSFPSFKSLVHCKASVLKLPCVLYRLEFDMKFDGGTLVVSQQSNAFCLFCSKVD